MANETAATTETSAIEAPAATAPDTSKFPREFTYGSVNLADPDKTMTPDKVVQHFAAAGYPDMTTATVDGPKVVGKKNIYTISRKVPTKG